LFTPYTRLKATTKGALSCHTFSPAAAAKALINAEELGDRNIKMFTFSKWPA